MTLAFYSLACRLFCRWRGQLPPWPLWRQIRAWNRRSVGRRSLDSSSVFVVKVVANAVTIRNAAKFILSSFMRIRPMWVALLNLGLRHDLRQREKVPTGDGFKVFFHGPTITQRWVMSTPK